jgi:surface antigen
VIVRPFGHSYHGYGHFHLDNDAWKWLAFTAITLKVLDNINEAAQRAHEDAQIKAATAPIGEKIIWSEGDASGSVVATKEGKDAKSGLSCREFQQTITVGGNSENAYGTACLQADGSWKIVQ